MDEGPMRLAGTLKWQSQQRKCRERKGSGLKAQFCGSQTGVLRHPAQPHQAEVTSSKTERTRQASQGLCEGGMCSN